MTVKQARAALLTLFGLLMAALALGIPVAGAAKLPGGACLQLDAEKKALKDKGVVSNLNKGPEWAKVNLSSAQVADVKRLLIVNEKLLFRCNRTTLAAARKRRNSPAFKKWLAVKPPVPQRNPKFSALKK